MEIDSKKKDYKNFNFKTSKDLFSEDKHSKQSYLKAQIFYYAIYTGIQDGLCPSEISKKKLNVSKQRINRYVRILKEQGYIYKISRKCWKTTDKPFDCKKLVKILSKDGKSYLTNSFTKIKPGMIRGHAFQFTLKISKDNVQNWNAENRRKYLRQKGMEFKDIGFDSSVQRIKFRGHKVWLCNHRIVIYWPKWKMYFTEDAKTSRNYAIDDLMAIVKGLECFFHIHTSRGFRIDGKYVFKVSKQHHSLVKNSLAMQYNRIGKKLYVYNQEGTLWFIIDNSYQLHEAEVQGLDAEKVMDDKIEPFFNSVERTGINLFHVKDKFKEIDKLQDEALERIKVSSENQINVSMVLNQVDSNVNRLSEAIHALTRKTRKLAKIVEIFAEK